MDFQVIMFERDAFMVSLFLSGKISILLASIKYQEEKFMSNVEEILKSEYSKKFDEIRKASMVQSFFKYGPARKNYINGNCNALASMENCIKKYQDTGNTEYLTDAANYLMLEFMYPQHEKAHYKRTGSDDSAGLVGLCATEMEQLKKDSFYD